MLLASGVAGCAWNVRRCMILASLSAAMLVLRRQFKALLHSVSIVPLPLFNPSTVAAGGHRQPDAAGARHRCAALPRRCGAAPGAARAAVWAGAPARDHAAGQGGGCPLAAAHTAVLLFGTACAGAHSCRGGLHAPPVTVLLDEAGGPSKRLLSWLHIALLLIACV